MKLKTRSLSYVKLLIPLIFLAAAGLLLAALTHDQHSQRTAPSPLEPAQTMHVSEPFSGTFYFNTDFGQTEFSKAIISAIDQSKETVEIAVYSFDHPLIRNALYRAARRGVKVVLILSDTQKAGHAAVFEGQPEAMLRLEAAAVNGSEDAEGSMHDKFLLADRGRPEQKLIFGSYNYTALQEKYDPSFLMETTRPEIVSVFGEEFDRIRTSAEGDGKILPARNPFAALITYPEGDLEIWFSPQPRSGGLRERLLSLIKGAQNSIEIMAWNLTDTGIARALAVQSGKIASVKILADDYNYLSPASAFPILIAEQKLRNLDNVQVLTDAKRNNEIQERYGKKDLNSFLHHHLLIVDGRTVLFGSNNWSANGFYNNYESAIVSDIPAVVSAFERAFEANYQKAQ